MCPRIAQSDWACEDGVMGDLRSVAKIVALGKIASVLGITFCFILEIKVRLTNIVLTVDFFLSESSSNYAEEAGVMDLIIG